MRCSCDTLALRARGGYKLLFLGSSVNDNNDVFILVSFISIAIDSFVSYRLLSNLLIPNQWRARKPVKRFARLVER